MNGKNDFKTHYFETSFGHLAYHELTSDVKNHVCIFLHGHLDSALDRESYRLILDCVQFETCYLLDSRSHGNSTRLKTYPNILERSEDLILFIQNLTRKQHIDSITLVSYSIASGVLLKSLPTVEKNHPAINFHAILVAPLIDLKKHKEWFKHNIKEMKINNIGTITKTYRSKGYFEITRVYFSTLSKKIYRNNLKKIKSQIYIILGTNDHRTSVNEAKELSDSLSKKAHIYLYKSLGHILDLKGYSLVSKKIASIVKSLGPH